MAAEMHSRELHHFETEKLLAEAGIDPDSPAPSSTSAPQASPAARAQGAEERGVADRAAVLAILADPQWQRSNVVYEWPDDEAEAYRALGWSEGAAAAHEILLNKQADAVMSVLRTASDVKAEVFAEEAEHVQRLIDAEQSVEPQGSTAHAMQGYVLNELEALRDRLRRRAAEYFGPASLAAAEPPTTPSSSAP
jgi:hypothetical protein